MIFFLLFQTIRKKLQQRKAEALNDFTTGKQNVAIGVDSLHRNETGDDNVAVGYFSGYYATGSKNTFVGRNAGRGANSAPYGSATRNVAVGYEALEKFTTGGSNVAIVRKIRNISINTDILFWWLQLQK